MTETQMVRDYLLDLQQRITASCTQLDGATFVTDRWKKGGDEPLQGDGVTMILEGGKVFERAGWARSSCSGTAALRWGW